ncbi:CBS domain-containing protein [Sporolactobacillus sp. THM7-7]|nr:CBS domain-containing protein [Sporolactobacillus sp. THM7-7]
MQINELMVKEVIAIREDDRIQSLIQTMLTHKIGGVPVLNDKNQLVGFVSDGDVLRAVAPKPQTIYEFYTMISAVEVELTYDKIKGLLNKKVKDFMKKGRLQTVFFNQDLDAVLKILSHHRFKKIPVIDNERRVVGIVSRGDVIQYIGSLL